MVAITTWFTLGALGMIAGTLALTAGFRVVPASERRDYALVVAVPFIAVVAYVLMALGIGSIQTQTGETLYLVRYIDWLLTTPLNVLYLGLIAGATRRNLGTALALMAATILLGLGGAILASPAKWALFAGGSLTFAGVVYTAFYTFDEAAQGKATLPVFRKLRAFVVVLWLIYPVIWLLAPSGIGQMELSTTVLVVSYIDVVAKVGFGLIALSGYLTVTEAEETVPATAD